MMHSTFTMFTSTTRVFAKKITMTLTGEVPGDAWRLLALHSAKSGDENVIHNALNIITTLWKKFNSIDSPLAHVPTSHGGRELYLRDWHGSKMFDPTQPNPTQPIY